MDNSPFLRVAHSAHSPDDEVGTFSIVKWVLFQLSRLRRYSPSGYFFDCQTGTFSLDKNIFSVNQAGLVILYRVPKHLDYLQTMNRVLPVNGRSKWSTRSRVMWSTHVHVMCSTQLRATVFKKCNAPC